MRLDNGQMYVIFKEYCDLFVKLHLNTKDILNLTDEIEIQSIYFDILVCNVLLFVWFCSAGAGTSSFTC